MVAEERALGRTARDTNHLGAGKLGELPDDRTDSAGSARNNDDDRKARGDRGRTSGFSGNFCSSNIEICGGRIRATEVNDVIFIKKNPLNGVCFFIGI